MIKDGEEITIADGDSIENLVRWVREQGIIITGAADQVLQHEISSKHIAFRGALRVGATNQVSLGFGSEERVSAIDFYNKAIGGAYRPLPLEVALKICGNQDADLRCGMEPITDGGGWDFVLIRYPCEGKEYLDVIPSGLFDQEEKMMLEEQVWFGIREVAEQPS